MKAIRAEELLNRKVGRFLSHHTVKWNSDPSLKQVLGEVRGPHWKKLVEKIRKVENLINKVSTSEEKKKLETEKSSLKSRLAAVTISGLGHRKLSKNKLEPQFIHSGLLQIDLDKKDNPLLSSSKMIELLKDDPHIVASFLSPSGGVKGICAISDNENDHLGCFLGAEEHFKRLGLVIDKQPKNKKSLCYLSHDPSPYIAHGEVEMFQPLSAEKQLVHTIAQTPNYPITQVLNNPEECINRSRLEMVRNKKQIEEKVLKWKDSQSTNSGEIKIWEEMVERRYKPMEGSRNNDLCDFIAYSMSRLSRDISLEIAKLMRELWDPVYNDSLQQHIYEANMQWNACEYSFRGSLGAEEKEIYEELDDRRKSVFRICRGLAFYENNKTSNGEFFLSCREFGSRIGLCYKHASNLLNEFTFDFGIIQEVQRGSLEGRKATQYRWNIY